MSTSAVRVFIVEDEALISMEIEDRLGRLGYSICGQAARGEAALDAILASQPDVVLMDIHLAGTLSGIDTAARLRQQSDVPVIFLTAYSDSDLIRQATEAESSGYLVKPVDGRELHATIQMVLHRHRAEQALREAKRGLEERVRERTTELERANAALTASDARRREAQRLARLGFWSLDASSGAVEWGEETFQIFGRDPATFRPTLEAYYREIVHPEDLAAIRAEEAVAYGSGRPHAIDHRFFRPDGSVGWVHLEGIAELDATGRPIRMRGTVQDITGRKAAEATLKESEENLAVTLQSIGEGVLATDAAGRVTRMNPVAERLTGWPEAEARGRPIAEVFRIVHELTRQPAVIPVDDVLATGTTHELANHTALIARDGTECSIADSAAPIRDSAGRLVGVVLVFRDESEARERRCQVERQRQLLDALRRTQETFIRQPDTMEAFEDLLAVALSFTASEYGFVGEVAHAGDGRPYLVIHTISHEAATAATRRFFTEHAGKGLEFHNLQSLLGAGLTGGELVIANQPALDGRRAGTPPGHPPLNAFMGIPIKMGDVVIGLVGVANRAGGYAEPIAAELQPLLATCGSLILARRNDLARRAAEEALRVLNADLEGEVQRRTTALVQSEQRFADLVETMNDAMIQDDRDGRLVYANRRFRQWYGIEGRELREVILEDYVAPEWRQLLRDRHDRRVRGEAVPERFQYQALRSHGERFWVDVLATPVIEEGRVVGTQSVIRDISEQKQMEQALRVLSTELVSLEGPAYFERVVQRLAELLDSEIAFVCRPLRDQEGRYQALAMLEDHRLLDGFSHPGAGTPCAEVGKLGHCLVGQGVQQRFPEDAYLAEQRIEGYAAVEVVNRKGSPIGLLGVMSRRPLAYLERVEAMLQLFALSVAAEMERRQSTQRFHDLFEFAPDGIVMTDRAGVIVLVNREAERMFGWRREELLGQPVEVLIPAALRERHVEERGGLARSGSPRPMGAGRPALSALHKDGTQFPVEISLNPMEGEEEMVVAAVRDISERKALERQAHRRQGLDAIGTLAGGIAHDLNNALAPIMMSVQILREEYPRESDLLDTLQVSAERAAAMVHQLLTFAKGSKGERASLQLRPLVEEMAKIVTATFPKNIQVQTRVAPDLPTVLGDATQLHQILLNLCVNARDAMPHGGTLLLEVKAEEMDAALARSMDVAEVRPGRYVVLRVKDSGTGIPPAILERIFDPFFTTKGLDKGTGLGLATVLGIARGHGGTVRAYSRHGRGSIFTVYLPAETAGGDTVIESRASSEFTGRGETILYVDDEAAVRDIARAVLTRLNFKPLTATDGTDGLIVAARHREDLRAVITDVHMPHMDGLVFVRALRRVLPKVPVVVASGRLEDDMAAEFKALGAHVVLPKPFTQEQLAEALRAALPPREPGAG